MTNASKFWLTDLVVVRAYDHVRAADAGMQARIKCLSARAVRARREKRRAAADGGTRQHVLAAVFSRRQLIAELHAEIVGQQKAQADPPSCLHDDSRRSTSMCEAKQMQLTVNPNIPINNNLALL